MANPSASEPMLPHPAQPFDRALIAAANEIREDMNLQPTDDLTEAAVMVLSNVVSATLEGAGIEHKPHPSGATMETALRAACFMAACLTGLSINLKNQGVELDASAVYTRAGFAVFQWYRPDQEAAIISSGGDAFKKLVASASDHPDVEKWIRDVQRLAAGYVLTRDRGYISLLRKEYLSLWQAPEMKSDQGTVG